MSTFQGLSVALSSLQSQRRAMDVAGQNIANAATPGYTRQRADLVSQAGPVNPISNVRGWTTGNGVAVADITRLTDRLASSRVEITTADAALASTRSGVLDAVQAGFNEPGDTGLQHKLGQMWTAWSALGDQDPLGTGGAAARVTVAGRSEEVAATLREGAAHTAATWGDVRAELGTLETSVNSIATSVADYNRLITITETTGATAHELADQRDQLVRQLSQLVGATSRPCPDGGVDVLVGGEALVSGAVARQVAVAGPLAMSGAATGPTTVTFADTGATAAVGGAAAALTEALTTTIPGVMAGYDRVAQSVATRVNAAHGDPAVFTAAGGGPLTAANVTASIAPSDIRAGTGGRGVEVADAVAALAEDPSGPDGQWRTFVIGVAGAASAAEVRATATQTNSDAARGALVASTAVDVDSEMVDLLTYQRAYEGAARVLTTVDQMLDTLINRTGVVGR
ncbi:flagellar hook-associated protein FlgK [uncultured Pseudokineococcus sp.]|uniref:flagellar hook-associated protein FlgK n=1 Tax=uncultured Pseudokineococcus sp. TaxID=1642928 RepID=UPI002635724E|nr:flagellar hook-associated protein FlgK [uncultured Pseudokineococcus sp.]